MGPRPPALKAWIQPLDHQGSLKDKVFKQFDSAWLGIEHALSGFSSPLSIILRLSSCADSPLKALSLKSLTRQTDEKILLLHTVPNVPQQSSSIYSQEGCARGIESGQVSCDWKPDINNGVSMNANVEGWQPDQDASSKSRHFQSPTLQKKWRQSIVTDVLWLDIMFDSFVAMPCLIED